MFKNYLTTAYRNLVRNKVNTFINIAGLAVSIACCIVIYVFIKHEKTFDSFHKNSDRIYRIVSDNKSSQGVSHEGYVSFALAGALRNDFPNLETATQVYTHNYATIVTGKFSGNRKVFYRPVQALKHSVTAKNTGFANTFSMRKVLVVTQFAVSQLLIIGTIVVAAQMHYFYSQKPGFRKEGIFTVKVPENDPQKLALFRNSLMTTTQIDFHFESMHQKIVPLLMRMPSQNSGGYGNLREEE